MAHRLVCGLPNSHTENSADGRHGTVLTAIAAFWGQVEYHTIQLTPWLVLKNRPWQTTAGLLLNYLTAFNLSALFQSAVRGHFAVLLGILGGLVLKALVIASTGLLVLQPVELVRSENFTVTDRFNLSVGLTFFPVNRWSHPMGNHRAERLVPTGYNISVCNAVLSCAKHSARRCHPLGKHIYFQC